MVGSSHEKASEAKKYERERFKLHCLEYICLKITCRSLTSLLAVNLACRCLGGAGPKIIIILLIIASSLYFPTSNFLGPRALHLSQLFTGGWQLS